MHRKIRTLSLLGAEKIAFPPKPDIRKYGRPAISNYRVASLLVIKRMQTKIGYMSVYFLFLQSEQYNSTIYLW